MGVSMSKHHLRNQMETKTSKTYKKRRISAFDISFDKFGLEINIGVPRLITITEGRDWRS